LEKLLKIFLPLAGYEFQPFDEGGDIESSSDYEDDMVDEIV